MAHVEMLDEVTARSILDALEALLDDIRFDSLTGLLVDYRTAVSAPISEDELDQVSYMGRRGRHHNRNRLRIAYVIPQRDIQQIIHLFLSKSDNTQWDRAIFADIERSRTWLKGDNSSTPLYLFPATD